MKTRRTVLGLVLMMLSLNALSQRVSSPNGKLTLKSKDSGYVVYYGKQAVLEIPVVGMEGVDVAGKLRRTGTVTADYRMPAGKRLHCTNEANEYRSGALVLRLYNDGVALRYELEGLSGKLPKELTAYRIGEGTRRWMQQWTDSYEAFFPQTDTYKVKPVRSFSGTFTSPDGYNCRWGYPALLEPADGVFVLLSEANIERKQSASCLYNEGELFRVVPDKNEVSVEGSWHTPWRVAIIGSLAEVVQSTLVTDVSEPSQIADVSWIKPGVVSWIYWAYNHGSNDYQIIKKYVDMAAVLHLPYVLIDAEWDTMKDGKTIEDAIAYARLQGVQPMIWYNSSVGWVDGAPTPKFRLNKAEDREREFAWCEKLGVAGVKIDFFSGDDQRNMDYCLDLLECAARHHLLVNFHGATIPRGWQRTWPNLLSTEAVYGAEWYNNVPTFTDKAAAHNATLPFTRNVVGPMDYTPCAFTNSQHPHITTDAHELALTVLFESGLQHLADRPESFLSQPSDVRRFLSELPAAWDETRLLAGYPGHYVVMARRSGERWYVAGINAEQQPRQTTFMMPADGTFRTAIVFSDNQQNPGHFAISQLENVRRPMTYSMAPNGGFVMVLNP